MNINIQESQEIGYQDICPNYNIGPNGLGLGVFEINDIYFYVYYRENNFYLAADNDILQFCTYEDSDNNEWVSLFAKDDNINSNSGTYKSVVPTIKLPTVGAIKLSDLQSLNSGDEFYVGIRYGFSDCISQYGWLRLQLEDCENEANIIVKDFKIENAPLATILAGRFNEPIIDFSSNIIEESLNDDGSFPQSIKLSLAEFNGVSFNSALDINDLNITGPNVNELNFQINVIPSTSNLEAELTIVNTFNPIEVESELYTISFLPSAFTYSVSSFKTSCNGQIEIDYYQPNNGSLVTSIDGGFSAREFNTYMGWGNHSALSSDWHANGSLDFFLHPLDNVADGVSCNQTTSTIIGTPEPGYIIYNTSSNFFQIETYCEFGSREAMLFTANDLPSGGEYQSCYFGGFNGNCGVSIKNSDEIYLKKSDLDAITEDYAYLAFKIPKDCGEEYYAWVEIDLRDTEPVFDFFHYSHEANVPIIMGELSGSVCIPEITYPDDYHSTYINKVILDGENATSINNVNSGNSGVGNINAYSDYTNLSVEVNKGESYPIDLEALVSHNLPNGTPTTNQNWYAWINWDEDPFNISQSESVLTGILGDFSINIPTDISDGTYTLRIIVSYYPLNNLNGCKKSIIYGEAEDYTIIIGSPPPPPPPPPPTADCCEENATFNFTNPLESTSVQSTIITSYTTVYDEQSVVFQAGQDINLYVDFFVEAGSDFHAYIAPCDESLCEDGGGRYANETDLTDLKGDIQIYPNPTEGSFTFAYKLEKASTLGIELYNSHGKLEKIILDQSEQEIGQYQHHINLDDLPSGIYFVKARIGYQTYSEKVVKM